MNTIIFAWVSILITCRVFMFADMQSGDSVIIKAQVSKSANRIPRNLWNLWNPQLSTFSTSWTDNASINGCIVCERGVGWKGAGGLKPLNGRLGSNWGRLMLDHCRQIWGYIGPWLTMHWWGIWGPWSSQGWPIGQWSKSFQSKVETIWNWYPLTLQQLASFSWYE